MNVERFKVEDVRQALMVAKGIASLAAPRSEIRRLHLEDGAELRQALPDLKEAVMKDLAENRLYKSISEGNGQMIRWFLGAKGSTVPVEGGFFHARAR